jgi:hypothetical protein
VRLSTAVAVAACALAAALGAPAGRAGASGAVAERCHRSVLGRDVVCSQSAPGAPGASGATGGGGGGGAGGNAPATLTVQEAGRTPTGAVCHFAVAIPLDTLAPAEVQGLITDSQTLAATTPACPFPAPAPTVVVTPAGLARAFWSEVALPVPQPSTRPAFAVTGRPVYLSTGGTPDPPAWRRPTPFGELVVVATGSFGVTWGDGSTSGPYATTGGPYPDGTITHTYDAVGAVTVTVREAWTATWSIGAVHGVLGGLATVGTLPDLPVRQIQAVVTPAA